MVDVYESEQEQLEAFKKWWSDNAVSVVAGIVIGVTCLLAWYGWQGYMNRYLGSASAIYIEIVDDLEQQRFENIPERADTLVNDYGNTHYASLAQFAAARAHAQSQQIEPLIQRLQWLIDHASTQDFKYIARLRLAGVYLARGKASEAEHVLSVNFPKSYMLRRDELQGDIAVANGDIDAARNAYDKVLNAKDAGTSLRLLQIKRDNLGPVEVSDTSE